MLREKMSAMTQELGEAKHTAERAKDDLQQERTDRNQRNERRIEELQRALKRADTERKGRILAEARLPVDLQDMQDQVRAMEELVSSTRRQLSEAMRASAQKIETEGQAREKVEQAAEKLSVALVRATRPANQLASQLVKRKLLIRPSSPNITLGTKMVKT